MQASQLLVFGIQRMSSKNEFQTLLKEQYGINKNISQSLTKEECERLLEILSREPSTVRLVESFAQKNSSLGQNNAYFSRMRSQAEKKLENLQREYYDLEKSIHEIERSKQVLEQKKHTLEAERRRLEVELEEISAQNNSLAVKVQDLTSKNDELTIANEELKKDNKNLKNIVDQIRLRLARDTKLLLEYEDSEIRKALIRILRWTLG